MIQSIQRIHDILSLFSIERPQWGITDIALSLGLPKTTVSSLVRTLAQLGFLEQDADSKKYRLGPKLFTLGIIMGETLEINQKSEALANQLAERTGLMCRVAIWDGDAALVTLNVTPQNMVYFARRIGPRIEAYCTSLGRALLAFMEDGQIRLYLKTIKMVQLTPHTISRKTQLMKELEQTRLRGYAINKQEVTVGRASIAVPIFKSGGQPAASISLTGDLERLFGSDLNQLVLALQGTSAEISRSMGFSPGSHALSQY
ncbi:MAG: IclR family transcriptional regulator [Deltaproteobacteria bacterium]|nr:IclR family transcriptional regulator [Deltaproteobacteria bacterium]